MRVSGYCQDEAPPPHRPGPGPGRPVGQPAARGLRGAAGARGVPGGRVLCRAAAPGDIRSGPGQRGSGGAAARH